MTRVRHESPPAPICRDGINDATPQSIFYFPNFDGTLEGGRRYKRKSRLLNDLHRMRRAPKTAPPCKRLIVVRGPRRVAILE